MLLGTLSVLMALPVFAEGEATEETEGAEGTDTPADEGEGEGEGEQATDYMSVVFETEADKLATMTLVTERYGYKMYYEPVTGEVAIVNNATGDTFFTNPYDINSPSKVNEESIKVSEDTKKLLYSQLIIDYIDGTGNKYTLNSYTEAAVRNQIKLKRIKNGIRVEYIMGKQETRSLVPRLITYDRLQSEIFSKIQAVIDDPNVTQDERDRAKKDLKNIDAYYDLQDPAEPGLSQAAIESIYKMYPITKQTYTDANGVTKNYAVYVYDTAASAGELAKHEAVIKKYAPDYDFEQLAVDHDLTGYKSADSNPVQFRMALEYTLDSSGLSVRLPANGIRFDQNAYQLENITILPYAGAGSVENEGYAFIPDGSGTLVRFENTLRQNVTASIIGTMYGNDYTYHNLSSANNQQVMRMPIFGIVKSTVVDGVTRKSGYLAIIEEGDSLAKITESNGYLQRYKCKYNSIYTSFNPRPKDSYDLSSTVTVSGNSTVTVVSDRKYTGSLKIRYMLLTDKDYAKDKGIDATSLFPASYVGMAQAYRSRLLATGALTKLEQTKQQIPLYIETLGVIDVQDTFLSIPITVKRELTTFEDIKSMTGELNSAGINNLIYKLTGYTNGGMVNTAPNRVEVEDVVGGDDGFKDFIDYVNQNGIGMYLDSDFGYVKSDESFDGFNRKKQAIRTIDDRFTRKRVYSAILQTFTNTSLIAVSPSVFTDIFSEAEKDLNKFGVKSISLGTLGSDLNSDFDEDDPYNREDSKANIVNTLSKVKEAGYSIMIDGGNSYAVAYADHVLNVSLDSSKLRSASEAVPMFGLVYHGYLSFAGTPTNMVGDMRYETLKILENGANPYFILVYRNSEKLKEDEDLSSYYSISYTNWKEDLVSTYGKLSAALSPVMYSEIVGHDFIRGERIPSAEELEADMIEQEKAEQDAAKAEQDKLAEEERKENLKDHLADKGVITNTPETEAPDGGETETPDGGETETPDGGETETPDNGETETPDNGETEAPDNGETEAPDNGETETPDNGETETPDGGETEAPEENPPAEPEDDSTKYTSDNGMIVKVTFENGYFFILNYNVFDVTVEELGGTAIKALGYVVVGPDGSVIINSGEEVSK